MLRPIEALELQTELQVSSSAIGLHAAYLAGAQTEHLDDLRTVMFIDGSRLREPQDPSNPAEMSYLIGWQEHFDFLHSHGLESTPARAIGVIAAAAFCVQARLDQLDLPSKDLVVPHLYPVYMPRTFHAKRLFNPTELLFTQSS